MLDNYTEKFSIISNDFTLAGEVSAKIKGILKMIGIDSALTRRVTIAAYEAELNMVIHSNGGIITLEISPDIVRLSCEDTGPGIEDIGMAMQEGYSTASSSAQLIGFGAGMGLPNIKKNSDYFDLQSGKDGTSLKLSFKINKEA